MRPPLQHGVLESSPLHRLSANAFAIAKARAPKERVSRVLRAAVAAARRGQPSRRFGEAELGDARRATRLVRMVARAAERPSGKLSEVFAVAKELDAAYDFVES